MGGGGGVRRIDWSCEDPHRPAISNETSAPEQTPPQGSKLQRISADQNAAAHGIHHFFHPREVHYFYEPVREASAPVLHIRGWHLVVVEGGWLYKTRGEFGLVQVA